MKERGINDGFKKVSGLVYRNGNVDVYCNKCGRISNGNHRTCPDCGSDKIVYLEGDGE